MKTEIVKIHKDYKPKSYSYNNKYIFKILSNDTIISNILKRGYLFEKYVLMGFNSFLKSGDFVLDIGANIGTFSIPISKMVGSSGKIYSFEPQSIIYDIFKYNIKINKCSNILLYKKAIGHKKGNVKLSSTVTNPNKTVDKVNYNKKFNTGEVSLGYDGEKTKMITIDSLKLKKCNAIKIDIEGAEKFAVYGAKNTINKFKPIIIYEKNYQKLDKKTLDYLKVPKKIRKFNIKDYLVSIGYNRVIVIPENNYLFLHKRHQKTKSDPNFNVKYLHEKNNLKYYKFIKQKW
jgi:FkbM family methyltransferase